MQEGAKKEGQEMKVYTARVVAAFLGLSEKRIKQLKDEGIIEEYATGLFDLREVTQDYIKYLKKGTKSEQIDLQKEKAQLFRAKREKEEMELRLRKGELHEAADVEQIVGTMLINFKSRLMAIPAKLAPVLAEKNNKAEIFKLIKDATDEALNELAEYDNLFEEEMVADEDEKAF